MLRLNVRSITHEAPGIKTFEFVDPLGDELPAFTAGSHVDVEIPGGFVRQYSLCNDPRERGRYEIAVLHVEGGRGGSRAMHLDTSAGDVLSVSPPRNNFSLQEDARRHLLIAGGIGITPVMAMVENLAATHADFTLYYCTRSPEHTAFRERLDRIAQDRVTYHHDQCNPAQGLDVARLLANYEPGTHLYCCGPGGLVAATAAASGHWPTGSVHYEYFNAPPATVRAASLATARDTFEVEMARSGTVLTVPADKTIVQVLREAGIRCETMCEAGLCGTCRTRYLAGIPEHRDLVLGESEHVEYLTICCSRSLTARLVLDL
jgi:vanillate O-demethylase ferredoxin subunit